MARTTVRPGRTLAVFFLVLAILYGLVALGNKWKPELGLDLQGGTRITLIANGHPKTDSLNEARSIIDERVNGSGVAEASVTTENNQYINVEIPGKSRADLVDTVKRQAQLRFRLVACSDSSPGPCASASTTAPSTGGVTVPGASAPSAAVPSAPATGAAQRAPLAWAEKPVKKPAKTKKTSAPTTTPAATQTASAGSSTTAGASDTASAPASPTASASTKSSKPESTYDKAVGFMTSPDPAAIAAYNAYTCPATAAVKDDPKQPLVTCGTDGQKYLLTPAIIEGTHVTDATYGIPQNDVQYAVSLDFDGTGRSTFGDATGLIAQTGGQFAIVLDGQVISAPTASSRISGSAQITGSFTQAEAKSLATSLKYGALPISFKKDPTVETIGPSLAGDQLSAGLLAGLIGLIVVMLYCLFYYRGRGVVIVGSLIVASAVIYALVLLLSKTAGFTLTLPGIAGLIVAVGITGDSFIVYFERIRDEMRDGKSMRVAVQSGFKRARATTLAADGVSLLASAVLYVFAAGEVKGFAFALGLSTLVDLAIFFWFTHPTLTWLSGYRFFNRGHRLSGLDKEALGVVGGNA